MEHRSEIDKQEAEFNEVQNRLYDNEKKLQLENDQLQKENGAMRKEIFDENNEFEKLKADFEAQQRNHENEVQLRLQFESKLNSLHAMHRDLKAKYNRATEEILEKENINKSIISEISVLKEEQVDLRALKIS